MVIALLVPEKDIVIDLVPEPVDPFSVKELPALIELVEPAMVNMRPPPDDVNIALAFPLTVSVFIVGETLTFMLTEVLITTSSAFVGTTAGLQLPAVFQLLLLTPTHVFVAAPTIEGISNRMNNTHIT
jgi:hypothetical protein